VKSFNSSYVISQLRLLAALLLMVFFASLIFLYFWAMAVNWQINIV